MPLISGSFSTVLCPISPCSTTAISSAVRAGSVAIRQCSTTSSPSNTPSTMLVLPTSIVSSMALLTGDDHGDVAARAAISPCSSVVVGGSWGGRAQGQGGVVDEAGGAGPGGHK